MNNETFLRFIEKDRDCEPDRLDMAVNKGLHKIKNNRFCSKKVLKLAAACVFTFVMCITLNLMPVKTAVENYYQTWHKNMPNSAEILNDFIIDITANIYKHLGGE